MLAVMPVVDFDTLAAARRMEDAGMERDHAAAVAEAVRDAAERAAAAAIADRDALATKGDLRDGLATLESRLTWRLLGFMAAMLGVHGGIVIAAVKLIP